ncbi:MAG: hypothetical protein AB7L84_14530 [Acidimicrobiia bacterium]
MGSGEPPSDVPVVVTGPPWPDHAFVIDLDRLDEDVAAADLAALEGGSIPSIAVSTGSCTGARLMAGLLATMLIAGPDSTFGRPGEWATRFARRACGLLAPQATTFLATSGEAIGAAEALSWHLVSELHDDPMSRAVELAAELDGRSPVAIEAILHQALRGSAADHVLADLD